MIRNFCIKNRDLIKKKFSFLEKVCNASVAADDVGAVADFMLNLALGYTNAERGSLMLAEAGGGLSIVACKGIDHLPAGYRGKIGEGIAGIVAKTRSAVIVDDIDKEKKFRLLRRRGCKTKSFISCPVICRNRLVGVLNISDRRNKGPFLRDEFVILNMIASQTAMTIENAVLMTELRLKAAELEEINRRLIESDAAKTAFITRISHELRTPLNSIKGSIYYLGQNEKIGISKQKEFFEIIAHGANELRNSVEHLLNFLTGENKSPVPKRDEGSAEIRKDGAFN